MYHGRSLGWGDRLGRALWTCAALALACGPSPGEEGSREPAPARIVSVGAELGRILVDLGLGPSVVGVDSPSLAAPELAHALDLGEGAALSAELARSLAPELVLVLGGPSDPAAAFAAALAAQGIPAHVLAPRDANGVLDAIARIGRLGGRELRAAALAARLTREVAEVATRRDGLSRLRVAWVIGGEPLVVVGGSGLLHELLELAGAENAFHTPQGERLAVAPAELAARAPDVVLGAPALLPAVPGAQRVAADPALAALPLLDLPARVRALYALLYPAAAL
jgi:ABC-type hemin transport system substrate-binding protein